MKVVSKFRSVLAVCFHDCPSIEPRFLALAQGRHTRLIPNEVLIVPETPSPHAPEVPVLKVFDGDGFLTRIRTRDLEDTLFGDTEIEVAVRFGFVDAPELDQPGGQQAKEFLTDLIGGRSVRIEILAKMDTGKSVDRHGRLVCVPYLEQQYEHLTLATPSGHRHRVRRFRQPMTLTRNVELEMVLNGWAWVMDRYGPDARYHEALNEARRERRGIWAMRDNVDPWTFKQDKALEARRTRQKIAAVICPREACGGQLVRRTGRFGDFLGCSRFPECSFSRSLQTQ